MPENQPGENVVVGGRELVCAAARCVLFRFGVIYFVLYFFPFPLQLIPWGGYLAGWYARGEQAMTKWVGEHLLGLEGKIVIQPTGSGDTMIEYVKVVCLLAIALAGTALWSSIDWKRKTYPRVHMVFRTYVRLALASVMLGYGMAKVFPMQFPLPGPDRLLQTYGNSSPMGILWTFMGSSPAYTIFAGVMESAGALLLMFRRTATFGGLWSAGVMLNVVMLNFCYDVPVKLYSTHLMLAGLVVALPDLGRILNVLVFNRPTGPAPRLRFERIWKNCILLAVEWSVVLLVVVPAVGGAAKSWKTMGPRAEKPALFGMYNVEEFELDGVAHPPLITDASRWRRFVVTQWGFAIVQNMTDVREGFAMKHDAAAKTVELTPRGQNAGEKLVLSFTEPETGKLVLEGPWKSGRVKAVMKKVDAAETPLMSRGFHWVQEFPYNR